MKTKAQRLGRGTQEFCRILSTMDAEKMERIVDIGCGDGRTLKHMKRFKNATIIGVDIDAKLLAKARQDCLPVLASGEKMPFEEGSLDLVVEFHTFHHIPDYTRALFEVYRCLKPGGYFLMVDAVEDNFIFKAIRDMHPITEEIPIESKYTLAELTDVLKKNGFSIKEKKRFGLFFEFTLGGIPGIPVFIKRLTSLMDAVLERIFGTEYCATCVILAKKNE